MSSFPSSFTTFPDLDTLQPSPNDKEKKKEKKNRHKSRHERRERGSRESSHRPREGKGRSTRYLEESSSTGKTQSDPAPNDDYLSKVCFPDRKGDALNIQYGSIHPSSVPKYYLVNGGRHVLGLPPSLVASHRTGNGVEIGPPIRHFKNSDLTHSSSRSLLAQPPSRRLKATASPNRYVECDGFIRLPSRKGKQREHPDETYRSIAKDKDVQNSDSEPSTSEDDKSSDDGSNERSLTAQEETLKSLEQALTAHPADAEKWLLLLDQTLLTIPVTSKNATRARSEITVSVLSRAISTDPKNAENKQLRLRYLKAGEEIWHESKLRSEWEQALHVNDIEIHMEWLEWRIRHAIHGIEGVMEAGLRIMVLRPADDTNKEIEKVRIFSRVAHAIRAAGYNERAMAMFQAEAELAFKMPISVAQSSFQSQLFELEKFWEAEYPRIGEEGSEGWDGWLAIKDQANAPPPSHPRGSVALPDLDPFRQWANEELQFEAQSTFPSRADDQATDPYSTVIFSDIREILFAMHSEEAKDAFRKSWLSFAGLHIPGFSLATSPELDWDDRWNLDYLTRKAYIDAIFPSIAQYVSPLPDAVAGALIGKEQVYSTSFPPVKSWRDGVRYPLCVTPATGGEQPMWTKKDVNGVDQQAIRHIFSQLRTTNGDTGWDVLALTFEAALSVKSALKLSKSFLSVNRDSLGHWRAHAQLHLLGGEIDNARKVYNAVLFGTSNITTREDYILLWCDLAEMEWMHNIASLESVLLQSVGTSGQGRLASLRAKHALEEGIRLARSCRNWKILEAWIKLRAFFALATSQNGGIEPMLEFLDQQLHETTEEPLRESLASWYLLTLYRHSVTLRRRMAPCILRDRAVKAVEEYSNNSIVMRVFLEGEKGQSIWGTLRKMLGEGRPKEVGRVIQEIWVAHWRPGGWANETERVRGGFSAAVEHERTRSSAVIWRFYLEFEIRQKQLHKAKKLLYRAIGECPLAKELYLLAFGPLRAVFQAHELNAMADTMVERGLRLHQGLDEALHGREIEKEGEQESQGEEDEIEYNARELARLRPY